MVRISAAHFVGWQHYGITIIVANRCLLLCVLLYLGAQEVQVPSVSTQVYVRIVRAQQAQFVGVAPSRDAVHLNKKTTTTRDSGGPGRGSVRTGCFGLFAETGIYYCSMY